jgi:hypothetical protein
LKATQETQISAFLANRAGIVADLCAALTERGVNILAICVLDSVDVGTLRMVVDDVETAKQALNTAGAAYIEVPVISVPIPNAPGAFAKVARSLAIRGVNIEYFYATASSGSDHTLGVFRVSNIPAALEIDFPD